MEHTPIYDRYIPLGFIMMPGGIGPLILIPICIGGLPICIGGLFGGPRGPEIRNYGDNNIFNLLCK